MKQGEPSVGIAMHPHLDLHVMHPVTIRGLRQPPLVGSEHAL
jgi:hypothetical protein